MKRAKKIKDIFFFEFFLKKYEPLFIGFISGAQNTCSDGKPCVARFLETNSFS